MFDTMLVCALSNSDAVITVCYRCGDRFFHLRHLKAKTKVFEAQARDFLFTDDCALAALNELDLQGLATCLPTAAKAFGLTVSLQKTEVMLQPAPGLSPPEPSIVIEDMTLNNVDSFTYLGSCLSSTCSLDKELSSRLAKAGVWGVCGITLRTKLAVYRAVVNTSLCYGFET